MAGSLRSLHRLPLRAAWSNAVAAIALTLTVPTAGPALPCPFPSSLRGNTWRTIRLTGRRVAALSWSPDGRTLAYVDQDAVRFWPSGTVVKLPAAWTKDDESYYAAYPDSPGNPYVWRITWRPDGRQLTLVAVKQDGLLLDVRRRAVLREFKNVYALIWHAGEFCVLDRPMSYTARQRWRCGTRSGHVPRSVVITDIAPEDSRVALIQTRPRHGPAWPSYAHVARITWRSSRLSAVSVGAKLCGPFDLGMTNEQISWSEGLRRGAALVGSDTGGGMSIGNPLVVRGARVLTPDPPRDWLVFADSPLTWFGDRIMVVLRYWHEGTFGTGAINRHALVLLSSRTGQSVATLLRDDNLVTAAAAANGNAYAYCTFARRQSTVVIRARPETLATERARG